MVADHVVVCGDSDDGRSGVAPVFFRGRDNRVSAAEIVMVLKYCVAIFLPVDTGIFLQNARCKVTIPQLN